MPTLTVDVSAKSAKLQPRIYEEVCLTPNLHIAYSNARDLIFDSTFQLLGFV